MITDTHTHVFWSSFDEDREDVLDRARKAGVERMLVVGTDVESSRAAFALCAGRAGLYPTAGIHPHDAKGVDAFARDTVLELCRREECVAVGETGLDFFKEYSPRAEQIANFAWHLELAVELGKPVIVHCRDAHAETAALLAEFPDVRGVMHCYTMGPRELEPYLAHGFHISFSGVVTYPRNEENRAAAALVPADRLLVETDCPFLAPQGFRGKRNEPMHAAAVVRELARVRGSDVEEVALATSFNAARLFALE